MALGSVELNDVAAAGDETVVQRFGAIGIHYEVGFGGAMYREVPGKGGIGSQLRWRARTPGNQRGSASRGPSAGSEGFAPVMALRAERD